MRLNLKTQYYQRSRRGKSPATYRARQPSGAGTDVHATVKLDPVLRKHPDLRRHIMAHEKREIKAWGSGMSRDRASRLAERATKRDDHFDTRSEFWGLIDKRKKGRKRE